MTKVTFVRHGTFGAPEGSEKWETIDVPPLSRLLVDSNANFRCMPLNSAITTFDNIPSLYTAAVGKGQDPLLVTTGVGTEIPSRSTKGGVNIKTQFTSPANSDDAILTPLAGNAMVVPITAISQPRFSTRVRLTQVTLQMFFAGFNETYNPASTIHVNPTTDPGDGAGFLFDPTAAVSTGLESVSGLAAATLTVSGKTATFTSATAHGLDTGDNVTISGATEDGFNGGFVITVVDAYTFTYETVTKPVNASGVPVSSAAGSPVVTYVAGTTNWVLHEKVNGTDTFIDSEVPVRAGVDYELAVAVGADLKPVYYINGVAVGTGASALTSGDSVGVVIGVEIVDASSDGSRVQHDFDCRYVAVERFIG